MDNRCPQCEGRKQWWHPSYAMMVPCEACGCTGQKQSPCQVCQKPIRNNRMLVGGRRFGNTNVCLDCSVQYLTVGDIERPASKPEPPPADGPVDYKQFLFKHDT